jgi:DedD protein
MREGAKKRLVGAVVIVALAVIFVPMLFEDDSDVPQPPLPVVMPDEPDVDERFGTESFLTAPEPYLGGVDQSEESWPDPQALSAPAGDGELESVYEPTFDEPVSDEPRSDERAPVIATPQQPVEPAPPAPMSADDGMPAWVTQVASLGTSEGAQQLADKLRGEGFSAFVEPAEVRGRLYYRVRVGPEVDRANAEKTASRLRQTYKDALIQRYP